MKINNSLFNIPIVNNIIQYDSTDSTNTKAKEFALRGSVDGTLIIAHHQTKGRGRLGRSFESPKNEGIYMSLLLRPTLPLVRYANITLITAVAVARAIEKVCHIKPSIKWPNDILVNGKKLVGILTESGSDYVIIGIGINLFNQNFPEPIAQTATSILMESQELPDEFSIIEAILMEFNELYDKFKVQDDLSFILKEYNKLLAHFNKEVYLIPHHMSSTDSNPYTFDASQLTPYVCLGINSKGELICKDDKNTLSAINSGEISLRYTKDCL
ncbi:MAG: biotin--[Lachnospiraceae bacterium]|nr:biotin--[acetyl-CoA-carboxylase] ligase [Lachnospiraceae bacterium]